MISDASPVTLVSGPVLSSHALWLSSLVSSLLPWNHLPSGLSLVLLSRFIGV